MAKQKLCPLCLEKGKQIPVCPNNGIYCYRHMQSSIALYAYEQSQIEPKKKRKSKA